MSDIDGILGRASTAIDLGRIDEALSLASQAVAQEPDYASAHVTMAWALFNNNDHKESLESAKRAMALNPNLGSAYDVGAKAANYSRKKDEAIQFATSYRELAPNSSRANRRYGETLFDCGKSKKVAGEAMASIREAIRLNPNESVNWNELGRMQKSLAVDDKEGARASFNKSLELNPNGSFAKRELAYLSEGEGDKASALALVQSVIRLDPTDRWAREQLDDIIVRFMTDLLWLAFFVGVVIFIGLAFALAPLR